MTAALTAPSPQLVARILREVDFDGRFEGYCLRERSGPRPMTMYRFEEVVAFFNDRQPRFDLDELQAWLRHSMMDEELARCVGDTRATAPSEQARCARIRELFEERLQQCRQVCSG